MPLLNNREVGDGFIALWLRDESTEQLLSRIVLSPEEEQYYRKIAHQARRRKEWLTWHIMIRELLGREVTTAYDALGTPVLVNAPGHISVSHSGDYVVLYYRSERCGLDIEHCDRKFARVSSRFISPEEEKLLKGVADPRSMALIWSTKEAVYKYAGIRGLDFLKAMQIRQIDPLNHRIIVRLSNGQEVVLRYEFIKEHCLVYTL